MRQAALVLASVTAVVKLGGWTREMILANFFGRSDAMDALLVALLIPNLLVNLLSESMNQVLIPTLIRVRMQQGQRYAQELLSTSMSFVVAALTVGTVLAVLLAHAVFPVIAAGFAPSKLRLSIHLFYALAPMVVLSGVAANCAAVLNSVGRFGWPALAPAVVPITTIVSVGLLHESLGIWSVAFGCVVGVALHASAMAGTLRVSGYAFRLQRPRATDAVRGLTRQYGATFLSAVVASGGLLVDQAMAAMLPAGSVSALAYGGRYVSVVISLLAGAVSTAVAPYFSLMVAQGDWGGCRSALRRWPRIAAVISVPLMLSMIGGAHALVRLTFQHGAFGSNDTAAVASVLAMYAIQIPFFVVSRIFYRFVLAMGRADLVLACGTINLLLDVALNLLLMRRMGVAGIALSTSLWSMSTCALFAFWSHRLLARERLGISARREAEVAD